MTIFFSSPFLSFPRCLWPNGLSFGYGLGNFLPLSSLFTMHAFSTLSLVSQYSLIILVWFMACLAMASLILMCYLVYKFTTRSYSELKICTRWAPMLLWGSGWSYRKCQVNLLPFKWRISAAPKESVHWFNKSNIWGTGLSWFFLLND